jgi:hypothetical protein
LARFVEAEFFHSLGSYEKSQEILKELGQGKGPNKKRQTRNLPEILLVAQELNGTLAAKRDDPKESARHPRPPDGLELAWGWASRIDRFYRASEVALQCLIDPKCSKDDPDSNFLQLGKCLYWERDPAGASVKTNEQFKEHLDRTKGCLEKDPIACEHVHVERRIRAKKARMKHRREGIRQVFPLDDLNEAEDATRRYSGKLLTAQLGGKGAMHTRSAYFVLDCLTAAHGRLHRVEHDLAQPFKEAMTMHKGGRGQAMRLLHEAEVLHTFVFVTCSSFPWIFATNHDERKRLVEARALAPKEEDPTRDLQAAAVSRRLSFLALNRRAFGYGLMDRLEPGSSNDRAFKDFHKLQRLLRVERRSLLSSPGGVAAARAQGDAISEQVFIDGLDALAETHIGELYRSDHAHPLALRHFCDAYDRLDLLDRHLFTTRSRVDAEEEPGPVVDEERHMESWLRESRWRIRLLMSKGKGFYEVGNMKRSVKWLVRSWRALLYLHSEEEQSRKLDVARERCSELIERLKKIRNDPDFSKDEIEALLISVVSSAEEIAVKPELSALAAEILLGLGHTIFVMQLDGIDPELDVSHVESSALAHRCLSIAVGLDSTNVLIDADLLKIELARGIADGQRSEPLRKASGGVKRDAEIAGEWPYGRGEAEQAIRMIEYLQLRWLGAGGPIAKGTALEYVDGKSPQPVVDQAIARALIRAFLTHTDSINVKQSQVYRYLMRARRDEDSHLREADYSMERPDKPPSIELICLRRYSSFFPFVPRPSAFRALGGGYFIRLHNTKERPGRAYGVAIDPGPDFIDNLYRCGFSLSDIDMIVVTHDHADHAANLDPLLSLLGYRIRFGDKTYTRPPRRSKEEVGELRGPKAYGEARRLLIVGNESVARRLDFFNPPHMSSPQGPRVDAVRVLSFDEFSTYQALDEDADVRKQAEFEIPSELCLKPVMSIRHDDGYGYLAYGMRISLGRDGPSIGFTGDTGGFRLKKEDPAADGQVSGSNAEAGRWKVNFDANEKAGLERFGETGWRDHWRSVLSADVIVAHMSAAPFTQLQAMAEGEVRKGAVGWKAFDKAREKFADIWEGISEDVKSPVNFAFWLSDSKGKIVKPLSDIPPDFKWPADHLYFAGLLQFARAYRDEHEDVEGNRRGLFLVGELREELGTFRSKIARSLNKHIFKASEGADGMPNCRALTADVGLRLLIEPTSKVSSGPSVRVLCSTCDLDNDRPERERFHDPSHIYEVCIKGENEGIFYNCASHDPSKHSKKVFLERIERYDIFAADLFR